MKEIVLVYITCKDKTEAEKIGKNLLDKKLVACINIFSDMESFSLWPPKTGEIERASESVLLLKTIKERLQEVEARVLKIHSYDCPAIIAITAKATDKYADWVRGELV